MQRRVTVVLATIWLVLYVGVVGAATHYPSHPTLDQYSPLVPYRRPVYQRVEGQPDWKDQEDPGEDQSLDLSIGPRRTIHAHEFPRRTFEVKYPGKDLISPREDVASDDNDFSSLRDDKQSRNFAGGKRNGHKGTKLPESFSREIPPPVELEDPFVADDTFQDQGPGSVEIYKLDLFKEKSLLAATSSTPRFPVRNKSKSPKKTSGRVSWKGKTPEYKTTSPKAHHKQSNFFEDVRAKVPPHGESFGVGGVPELQVGCEGLEASSHKLKRSINVGSKEKGLRPFSEPWTDVTPISLDLDYELSSEEGYEEMDELLKLKKLETTTERIKQNRGDMDATIHQEDFLGDKRYPEKLPVRGDLGNASKPTANLSTVTNNRHGTDARGNLIGSLKDNLNDVPSKVNDAGLTGNQRRKLLWLEDSTGDEQSEDQTRLRRAIWGFGEDEGVVTSDELQTENQRRRQEYERKREEEARRRAYEENRLKEEASKITSDYEKQMQQKEREEQERLRRIQQVKQREEERRREEQRRREQELNQRRAGQRARNEEEEERLREHRMREAQRRQEEERRRQEVEAYRRRPHYSYRGTRPEEDTKRQRMQEEEAVRRQQLERDAERRRQEQEERRRMLEEERRRSGQYRYQEEAERRRQEEEKRRRMQDASRSLPEEDRRNLEERQRQWMMKRRQEQEEEEKRRRQQHQDRSRNESPANILYPFRSSPNETRRVDAESDRRLREQRERERMLREYQNRGVNTSGADWARSGGDARRYRPEDRQAARANATRRTEAEEEARRRYEMERRKLEEERRLQEYVRRNQPTHVSPANGSHSRTWLEGRTAIERARQYDRPRYPTADAGRRNHGPLAPVYVDPRGYTDENRRRQEEARRAEEERRMRERQRQEQEELRKEMQRREEEVRKAQSRRYEEERRRQEAARLAEEQRKKELIEEESRRSQAGSSGRTWPVENRRPVVYEDRSQPLEYRRRQDTGLIPANLHFDDARAAAERERQRQQQERRRMEEERRRQEGNRMRDGHEHGSQWRRQEEARLNALPVSARIIVRPPMITSRLVDDADFMGINPSRQGVQVPRFPVPPTASPPVKSPSACVWAVVQCCSATRNRYVTCFESLGCPGINWDPNPCRGPVAQAALDEVMKFYAAAEKDNTKFKK